MIKLEKIIQEEEDVNNPPKEKVFTMNGLQKVFNYLNAAAVAHLETNNSGKTL